MIKDRREPLRLKRTAKIEEKHPNRDLMLTKEGMAGHSEKEGMVACLGKEGMSERLEGGDSSPYGWT